MKIIDRERGMIFGINFIDLLVGVIIVFLLFSFGSKVLVKDLTYSGDEMYSAIQAYQRLDSKGFLIEAEVEGKWIADQEEVRTRGILVRPRSGAFEFKTKDGQKVWLGGSMSYLEDIAVSRMTFVPLDNFVVRLHQPPVTFDSYSGMIGYFKDIKTRYGGRPPLHLCGYCLHQPRCIGPGNLRQPRPALSSKGGGQRPDAGGGGHLQGGAG
jgi:hypothetical protein